jgi:undecaprenyl-diphosphatase
MLGVHYLSDVWAGYLVGSLWLIIGISITEWLVATDKLTLQYTIPKHSRKLAWSLTSLFLLYYASASVIFPANWLVPQKIITVQLQGNIAQQLTEQKAQYTQTFLGEAQQPLSVAIASDNEDDLLAKLHRAGWQDSDKPGFESLKRLALEGMVYTTAPVAPGFWYNKVNDYALAKSWQLQGKPSVVSLRLWKTPYRLGEKTIVVGTVRAFDRIEWRSLRHVYPDIDSSREVLLESLQQGKELVASCKLPLTPAETNSYLLGNRFFTRGELLLLDLGTAYQAKDSRICPILGQPPTNTQNIQDSVK